MAAQNPHYKPYSARREEFPKSSSRMNQVSSFSLLGRCNRTARL